MGFFELLFIGLLFGAIAVVVIVVLAASKGKRRQ
jgi:hypothetical protein